jgi:hypothetical protein
MAVQLNTGESRRGARKTHDRRTAVALRARLLSLARAAGGAVARRPARSARVANLLDEIEALARQDKKSVKNKLVVLLTHLLKHQFQPEQRSSGWRGSIVEHRRRLRYDLEESPSLRPHAAEVFARAYADAREQASAETGLPVRSFPKSSPYTLEQTLDPKFLPD